MAIKINPRKKDAQHHQEDIEQPAEQLPALPVEDVLGDIVHTQLILRLTLHIAEVEVQEVEVQEVENQDGPVLHPALIIHQRKFEL